MIVCYFFLLFLRITGVYRITREPVPPLRIDGLKHRARYSPLGPLNQMDTLCSRSNLLLVDQPAAAHLFWLSIDPQLEISSKENWRQHAGY
jgi:hypothetical protein